MITEYCFLLISETEKKISIKFADRKFSPQNNHSTPFKLNECSLRQYKYTLSLAIKKLRRLDPVIINYVIVNIEPFILKDQPELAF